MPYSPLSYNLLDRDHLIYELKIRGILNISSKLKNEVLAQNLCYLLKCESSGTDFHEFYNLEATDEIQACLTIYNYLNKEIYSILYNDLICKIDVTLWHLRSRLGRIVTSNSDQIEQITLLFEKLDSLENSYLKKRKFLLEQSQSKPVDESSNDISSPSSTNKIPQNIPPTLVITDPDYVPISKWGFVFEGKHKDSLDILQFIRKVSQKIKTQNVDEGKLLRNIGSLFRDRADVWFRSVEDQVVSWDDLCCRLKKEFLPRDYEKVIRHQIKSRYQKKTETIGTFIAHIDELISYLPHPLEPNKRLQIIRQNMLVEYQDKLTLIDINSEEQLRTLVDKIEEGKSATRRCSNSTDNKVRFVDSTYSDFSSEAESLDLCSEYDRKVSLSSEHKTSSKKNTDKPTSSNKHSHSNLSATVKNAGQVNSLKCYKCGSSQHLVRDCALIKCYKCGNLGYTLKTCPKCSSSSQGNGRRA